MRLKLNSLLLFLSVFMLFNPMNVAACSYNELSELKTLASNINISYDYEIVNNDAVFSIKLWLIIHATTVHTTT